MKNKIDQYTDTDDEKLFALIEQGDEGAFTQAYERYHKLLYVLAYRYLMKTARLQRTMRWHKPLRLTKII